jgi:nucleotide-binding universal stress UspA family protein
VGDHFVTRRILHPSDFSAASSAAFKKAIDMAKSSRAQLIVAHVISPTLPVPPGDGYVSPKVYEDLAASTRAWARKHLDKLLASAKKSGVRAKGFLLDGVPHEQIVRFAKSRRPDLVVMGAHGRSGLAKLFLGSVAGRVVAAASCPVLTVKGR